METVAEKDILQEIMTCMQCGSCSSSCPGADGIDMTRRQLWRMLQMGDIEEVLSSELFWQCTTCSMCEIRCPRGIPLNKIITALREKYNEQKGSYGNMQQVTTLLTNTKSITGDEPKNRMLWTENIPDITPEQRNKLIKDKAEIIYFTGCVSALFPQAYKIPQSLTKIMLDANIDFSLLGEEEWCCGYPYLAAGCGKEAIKDFAEHNLQAVKAKGAKTLLLSCPTCYHIWKHDYSEALGNKIDIEIKHYSEYLPEIIKKGGIDFKTDEVIVTYHDPCDLGRKSGVIEAPRELIKMLPGVKLIEMRFVGKDSKCCGGGGNLEMINAELSLEIAQKRVAEAIDTNAQYLLTTCQQCKRTLQNAVRKARARIKVYDLLEFIAERINTSTGGEQK